MKSFINFTRYYDVFRDISVTVHSSTCVEEVLELVVWKTTEVLGAKGGILHIIDLLDQNQNLYYAHGLGEKYLSKKPVSDSEMITDLCQKKRVVVIDDIQASPLVQNKPEIIEEGILLILDVPLILRDKLRGVIRVYFDRKVEFGDEELNFIGAVAEQCACAIDKARMIEEQQSNYDHLALQTEKLSALGRMAGGIAHEINNPLAGILLFSTNMRKKVPEKSPLKDGLEVIIQETIRCKGIIQALLEFSRDKEPERALASLNDAIEKALKILENEFHLHHISIKKSLSSRMPDTLMDVNLVQQVFVNLFINAVEAIQENGVITIKSSMSSDGKSARIEIEDTGCGIPGDNVGRIFDPFFSTKANGTGLGLAVSYGIIQKHLGEIRASSKIGGGSRFTIDIPLAQ
ncbi:MAG: GAF domain-containing protein [Deltaproteobacteria bacterium]|nr:GAF domain-containing protein [Deltaproteobacteria bacterium]MBW2203767.1 GAF domain-containing protein [Deltaproteobacteria bacterium]